MLLKKRWRKALRRLSQRWRPRWPRLWMQVLENRTMPSITTALLGQSTFGWQFQGPGPATFGQAVNTGSPGRTDPVTGAINVVAVHPTNPNIGYAGTVNGGVWKTTNLLAVNPLWLPKSDGMSSLSISSLVIDSTNPNILYAGTGVTSSARIGIGATGIYRSADAGEHWSELRSDNPAFFLGDTKIVGPLQPGPISQLQVSAGTLFAVTTKQDLLRNSKGGASDGWERISVNIPGLQPNWTFTDLVVTNGTNRTIYASALTNPHFDPTMKIVLFDGKVFRGTFGAANSIKWDERLVLPAVDRLKLATRQANPNLVVADDAVYIAGISPTAVNAHHLTSLRVTFDGGTNWSALALPFSNDNGFAVAPDLHPGGQADLHFSMSVDPTNQDLIYLGGDRQPTAVAKDNAAGLAQFAGRIFRGTVTEATKAVSWEQIVGNATADMSAPHGDSRGISFVWTNSNQPTTTRTYDLLETDDAGVYRLTFPQITSKALTIGEWSSIAGDGMGNTELLDIAFDRVTGTIIGGAQDIASLEQLSPGQPLWSGAVLNRNAAGQPDFVMLGDGGDVAVDSTAKFDGQAISLRYALSNNFDSFYRTGHRSDGTQVDLDGGNENKGFSNALFANHLILARSNLTSAELAQQYVNPQFSGSALTFPDFSSAGFQSIRLALNGVNNLVASQIPILHPPLDSKGQPLALTSLNTRIVIAREGIYESFDGGMTATEFVDRPQIAGGRQLVQAIAYGGGGNADVIYAYRSDGLMSVRTAVGATPIVTALVDLSDGKALPPVVTGLQIDPTDSATAYALTLDGRIFRTTNSGSKWDEIPGNLAQRNASFTRGLALVPISPGGINPPRLALMVGGIGVFAAALPMGDNPTLNWVRFGNDMPNALVMDLHYDVAAHRLVAATAGRGAWSITSGFESFLHQDRVLQIQGSPNPDTITIAIDANNSTLLDVFDGGTLVGAFPRSQVGRVEVFGNGGSDQLIVDTSRGAPAAKFLTPVSSGGIMFDGGAGLDAVTVFGPVDQMIAPPPDGAGGGVLSYTQNGSIGQVSFLGTEFVNVPPVAFNLMRTLREGLEVSVDKLGPTFAGVGGLSRSQPGLVNSLGDVLSNIQRGLARIGDPGAPEAGEGEEEEGDESAGESFIRRMIEDEDGAFSLGDIGRSITTLDELRIAFDSLDDISDNVSFTFTGGVLRFDVQIIKDLDGQAKFHIGNNSIELNGEAEVEAEVALHLVFGVDSKGFFIDAGGNPDPEVIVSNIRMDDLDAAGRFGLTDVEVGNPQFTFDPFVTLSSDLREPAIDAVFGGLSDGLLRLHELDETDAALVATVITDNPEGPDVVLTTTMTVEPLDEDGTPMPDGFPESGDVRFTWDNVTDPGSFTAEPAQSKDQDFFNLSNLSTFNFLDGLTDLAGYFTTQGNADLFGVKLSFSGSSLGDLMARPTTPFNIADVGFRTVTSIQQVGNYKQFTIILFGIDIDSAGITVGDEVEYNTTAGRKRGTISALSDGTITVRFNAALTQSPTATPGFAVFRSGSLTHVLRGALGEIANPTRLLSIAPSLQSLFARLELITGGAVTLTTSGTGASRVIQFAAHFDPLAVSFSVPISLGDLIPGLSITGTAPTLTVTADASFDLKFGVRLDPALTTSERFFMVADAAPEMLLNVTAILDNPNLTASLGFLNVNLAEDSSVPNNVGIQFTANVAVNLLDNGADPTTPARITTSELKDNPDLVANTFAATISGSLNIPGLKLTPMVNGTNTLGSLVVSFDPNSANTAPGAGGGKIQSINDLIGLAPRAKLSGNATGFTDFNNLTAGGVLDMLKAAVAQLSALGAGGPLALKIPGLNKSLGELIDIGQEYATILGNPDESKTKTVQAIVDYLNPRLPMGSFVTAKVLPDAIEFGFSFTRTFTQDVPMQLDLQSLGGAFSTDVNGTVHLTLTPTVNLTIGLLTGADIDVDDRVYLNTTRPDEFVLSADANTGYVGGGAAVGGKASLAGVASANIVQARLKANPQVTVNLNDVGGNDNRLFLSDITNSIGSMGSLVAGTLTGLLQGVIPLRVGGTGTVTPPNPTITDSSTAWVSILGKLQNLTSIDFNAAPTIAIHNTGPAGSGPGGVDQPITEPDPRIDPNQLRVYAYGVDALINLTNINLNILPNSMISDFPALLNTLADLLRGKVLGHELPLIGAGLRDVSTSLFGNAADQLSNALNALAGALTPAAVRQAIFDVIGPGGLDALGDWDGINPASPNVNDVQLVESATQKQFNFRLKKQVTTLLPLAADFGFPGLGIHLQNTSLTAFANYDVLVRVGVNKTQGFYFDTTSASLPADAATRGSEEVILSAGVQLTGLDARGSLGFLSLQATPGVPLGGGANAITAAFKVNLKDPIGTDGRLLIAELGQSLSSPSRLISAQASVLAKLGLNLKLGFAADPSGVAPSLRAKLYFDWPAFTADPLLATVNFGPAPSIVFGQVQLDVGGMVNSFLAPILESLDPVLQAIAPVFEIINYPIPGLSDLGEAFPSFADTLMLNEITANGPGTVGDVIALALKYLVPGGEFINKAIDILTTVQGVISKFHSVNGSVLIDLGDLNLGGRDIRSTNLSSLDIDDLIANPNLLVDFSNTVKNAVGNSSPLGQAVTSFIDNSLQQYMGKTRKLFTFPLFDDPRLGLALLLGKDVDLFRFQPPVIDETLGFDLTAPFPLFPAIRFGFFAEMGIKIDLTFGFDTYGIRNWLSTWLDGGAFDPSRIFKGFYITDLRDGANDLPEISLEPGVGLSGGIDVGVASAYVKGGLFGDIQFFLNDCDENPNDGKIRFDGIPFDDPKRIADIKGTLTAELRAEVEIGVDPFSVTKEFNIAPPVTLVTFENVHDCPEAVPPILASMNGGTLQLHVGPLAAMRVNGIIVDNAEQMDVVKLDDNTIEVRGFGTKMSFPLAGVSKIFADGGNDNDVFTIDSALNILADLQGGIGNDTLIGGGGNDTIDGGAGNDMIKGNAGNDILSGGSDNDEIQGGDGLDTIAGNDGNDRLTGGNDRDIIFGGNQNDNLDGGAGDDDLHGEAGDDSLSGKAGNDQLWGDAGNDQLAGGDGIDTLRGGDNDDRLLGDKDNDTLFGEAGNDNVQGGAGDDLLDGGAGDDRLQGDVGNDTLYGQAGKDTLIGSAGNDILFGGSEDDFLYGESGNDQLYGEGGRDYMSGGQGNDTMTGADQADWMYGDDGNDTLDGGLGDDVIGGNAGQDSLVGMDGNDYLDGGTGNDTIGGRLGADWISGGDGSDILTGDAGSDYISGGPSNDTISGGDNDDLIDGGAGNDAITGDAGNDSLTGGSGADTIDGGDGNDFIAGNDGNDTITAGIGNDNVTGGAGDDLIVGGTGNDTIGGDAGRDIIWGGAAAVIVNRDSLLDPIEKELGYTGLAPHLRPDVVTGSIDGTPDDGNDVLNGGTETDFLFGGGGSDTVTGDAGDDYLDGGVGLDFVSGLAGNDLIRGGEANDTLRGGDGRDWLMGDGGDDLLFGDAGENGNQDGQRLYGGAGTDTLSAYAPTSAPAEYNLIGDTLFGGDDPDYLYGNLRQDKLYGDAGSDYIHGDYLAGPAYAKNNNAGASGGSDQLFGGYGQDQLFGGGSPDVIFGGPDSDWLEGQAGADQLFGGWGIDILVLDTDSRFGVGEDSFDGHGGNTTVGDSPDLLEVDIMLVQGDKSYDMTNNSIIHDTINLSEDAATGKLNIEYTGTDPMQPAMLRTWQVNWRAGNTPTGKPLVEQIQIAGLMGNDSITASLLSSSVSKLAYTQTWLTVVGGGPGNDVIHGTDGPDRLEGGPGSDIFYGNAGDDRLWGDTSNGSAPIDTDIFYGGQGNDDMIGGLGANIFYPWTSETSSHTEDTGLNRVLGSANATRGDHLYGGTGLDFLYGNGGPDILYNRDGTKFEDMQNASGTGGDAWKNYAKSTNRAWYLSGSAGNDTISINYITNPYNPLFGRHQVTFQTTGAFDPRFIGFDSFGAFDKSDNRVATHSANDNNYDVEALLIDPATGLPRSESAALNVFQAFGLSSTDIVNKVFGPEPSFDAIIIDALGGNDSITAGDTVQRTVWVDAGSGDDTVRIQPALAFLPDATDPMIVQIIGSNPIRGNDDKATAYNFGSIAGNRVFRGLTIDSARTDQPDIDWYKFKLAAVPAAGGDIIRVKPLHDVLNLNLVVTLVDGNGATIQAGSEVGLGNVMAGTDYWLKVESIGAIPVDYDVQFIRAIGSDAAEPNNSPAQAYSLGRYQDVGLLNNLTVSPGDDDWFSFSLPTASPDAFMTFSRITPQAVLTFSIRGPNGEDLGLSISGKPGGSISLSSLPAGKYTLSAMGDRPTRYLVNFNGGSVAAAGNGTLGTAFVLPALTDMPVISQTITPAQTSGWFQFTLGSAGAAGQAIGVQVNLAGGPATVNLVRQVAGQQQALRTLTIAPGMADAVRLEALEAGTYWLQLTGPLDTSTNTAKFTLSSYTALSPRINTDFAFTNSVVTTFNDAESAGKSRRDVVLGGPGNDVLQGGSGSDWIFGGAGNDVLTGGLDRQVEDLIFGEDGDDRFQMVPDYLTLNVNDPSRTQTFDNAGWDDYFGGAGRDRVVYQGADGLYGRDFVLLGYDRFLHRYRVGALVLNTADNQFVYEGGRWATKQATFQARDIEGMLVDTRGGSDVVHAGDYIFDGQSWGVERGDVQDRATVYDQLEINGGAGQDIIYGGVGAEVIFGGPDNDYIAGGAGDDRIIGENGNDRIAGASFLPSQVPPTALQNGTPDGITFPTAPMTRAYYAYELAMPEPLRDWNFAGVALPNTGPMQQTVTVGDAFAFEGRLDNDKLSRFIPIGDFNGDKIGDYLLASNTPSHDYYVLLGPLTPDALSRVDTRADIDPSTYPPDLRVRGDSWSFTQSIQDEDEQAAAADLFRITGQAQIRINGGTAIRPYAPSLRPGDFNGDGLADIVRFGLETSGQGYLEIIYGTNSPLNYYANGTSVALPSGFPTGAQVYPLNRDFSMQTDLMILGTTLPSGGANQTVGYIYFNNNYIGWGQGGSTAVKLTATMLAGATISATAGDYNNDGRDDILIGITDTAANHVGRVYLLPSYRYSNGFASNTVNLDLDAKYVWTGYGLGPVYNVGDFNNDGDDEIAFGRTLDGVAVTSYGAFVYVLPGDTSITTSVPRTEIDETKSGFIGGINSLAVIQRGTLPAGTYAYGTPQVTAGDFDGNGFVDLAVGLPQSTYSTSPTNPLMNPSADPNANKVFLFRDVAIRSYYYAVPKTLSNAAIVISGEAAGDQFGWLTVSPADLNGDRIPDLVIGAPNANVDTALTTMASGRVYTIFGGRQSALAPSPTAQFLTNRDIPGSGLYVVESSDGQPFFHDQSNTTDGGGTVLASSGRIGFSSATDLDRFDIVSGTWQFTGDKIQATAPAGGDAIALLKTALPTAAAFRLEATIDVVGTPGENDFRCLVFDYLSPTSYKFARMRADLSMNLIYFEIGEMTSSGRVIHATGQNIFFSFPAAKLTVDVQNGRVSTHYFPTTGNPGQGWYGTEYTFPSDDLMNYGGDGGPFVTPTRVGLMTHDGGVQTFDDVLFNERERWYRFSTLGDGQPGDQVVGRVSNGVTHLPSRPAVAHTFSTQTDLLQPGLATAASTFYLSGGNYFIDVVTPPYKIGGPNSRITLFTLDLTPLMGYMDDPNSITLSQFKVFFDSYTGPAFNGQVTLQTLDAEPDATQTSADAAGTTAGYGSFSQSFNAVATGSPISFQFTYDLTEVVRAALARGRMRIGFILSGGGAATPLQFAFNNASSTRFTVATADRHGVSVDLYDGDGRKLAYGKSIVDLRDIPAGDYYIRVSDAFMDDINENGVGNPYGAAFYNQRTSDLRFRIEIEAPKLGEADAPTDRDDIRGNDGNDIISGGDGVDHLYGGPGNDMHTAVNYEVQDLSFSGSDTLLAPPASELETNANGVTTQDKVVFPAVVRTFIEPGFEPTDIQIGLLLGIVISQPNGFQNYLDYELLRPIYASEMTRFVEFKLLNNGVTSTGLEYATNLEYLTMYATNTVALEPGIRYGNEAQGQLGMRRLRYLDLKDNILSTAASQTQKGLTPLPLANLTGLLDLRFLNLDNATIVSGNAGPANVNPWTYLGGFTNLQWLSAENAKFTLGLAKPIDAPSGNLTSLRYLALNNTTFYSGARDLTGIASFSSLVGLELNNVGLAPIEPLTGHVVIDNQITYAAPTGYAETGPWTGGTNAGAFQSDYRILPGVASGTASYTLTALNPGQTYDLWATWTADETHTNQARYSVFNGTTLLTSADVSQSLAATGTTFGGRPWQKLLSVNVPVGVTSLRVDLTNMGNGHLIADAVRLSRIVLPNLVYADLRTNPAIGNDFFDYTKTELQNRIGSNLYSDDNAAPVLPNPGTQLTFNGQLQSLTLSGSDSPGQTLTYSAFSSDSQVSLAIVGNRVDIIPPAGFTGIVPLTVRVSDGGRTTDQTFDVRVGSKNVVGEFRVNNSTTSVQSIPVVAVDADGDYVVVWHSNHVVANSYDIYARRYYRDGMPKGLEFRVNSVGTTNTQSYAEVAMDANGDFVVAWHSNQQNATNGYDIYARRYDSTGAALGGEFRVNASTLNTQAHPAVAMDNFGEFVVTWFSNHPGSNGYDIYAQRYNSAGSPVGGEFRINSGTVSTQSYPAVAMDYNGDFVVAYNSYAQTGDTNYGVFARYFNIDTAALGTEFRVNTYTTGEQSGPAIAMNYSGEFVITWHSNGQISGGGYDVFAQPFKADQTKLGVEIQVNAYTTSTQSTPAVAIDHDGDFAITWQSYGQDAALTNGIYARRYDKDASLVGPEFLVNAYTTNYQSFARIAMDYDGDMVATWASSLQDGSSDGVFARQYFAAGTPRPLSADRQSNVFTSGDQALPAVAAATDGSYVVTWESNGGPGETGYGIFARRHAADGTPIGASDIHVNVTTTNDQRYPTIAMAGNGSFVIAWISNQTGSNAVYARRFAADGTPVPGEITVDTVASVLLSQNSLSIGSASDGRFVVSWFAPDASGDGVYARRFDAVGAPQGSRFLVNQTQTSSQQQPSVAVASGGSFIVTWSSFGQDGSSRGVYCRQYAADGMPQAGEFRVNTTTANSQAGARVGVAADGSFVVAWQSDLQDGDSYGIFAQRFVAAGTPLGGEIPVNVFTTSVQAQPAIAVDVRGDFTITWSSYLEESPNSFGIIARRYTADGIAVGNEFAVNTFTADQQQFAAVALAADGSLVVAWQSNLQDSSGNGVFSRRFTNSGAVFGVRYGSGPTEGVTIFADLNNDGLRSPFEPFTVTDSGGNYVLRGIPGGTRTLREQIDGGWGSSSSRTFVAVDGEYLQNDNIADINYDFDNQRYVSVGADRIAEEGQTIPFAATTPYGGLGTVQWSINGVDVSGATMFTYNFVPPDNGTYSVSAAFTIFGFTYIDSSRVFVANKLPQFKLAPTVPLNEGETFNFDSFVSDAAGDVLNIEWYIDNVLVPGATGPSLMISWPDNGNHSVRVRAHDDDDPTWFEATSMVTVNNVDPQNVSFVAPSGAIEGTPIMLNGTFADPGTADTHTFMWSVTGPGGGVVATGTSKSLLFTPADNGNYTATFTVTDDDLGSGTKMATFSVTNAPPQDVVINGPNSIDEELPASFTVTFADPGTADTHSIAWEVRDAGNNVVATGSGLSFMYTPIFSGLYTVTVTVTDDDMAATPSGVFPLRVNNVRPRQVSAGMGGSGPENSMIQLTGSFREPELPDVTFEPTWSVSNANGDVVTGGNGVSFSFVPPDNGTYTATFTVTNIQTGLSTSATTTVTATNINPIATSFTGPASAFVNTTNSFSFNGLIDASDDLLAGLHFAYDFDNDGKFDTGDGTYVGSITASSQDHAFTSTGMFTVRGRVIDKDGGFTDYTRNINVTNPQASVESIVINQTAVQRSKVTRIDVTFSDTITFVGVPAAAFTLSPSTNITLNVSTSVVNNKTVATITFTGSAVIGGSLPDGNYSLTVNSSQITFGLSTGNVMASFFRLFGDADGNRAVNSIDFAVFRSFFGLGSTLFDYDGDNSTSANDFAAFRARFGITLMP